MRAFNKIYKEVLHAARKSPLALPRDAHTLAQLQAEAKEGVAQLFNLNKSLQAELHELRAQIPALVREIWGGHGEALATMMARRQDSVALLLRRWQDAEHRLIAVANSLATLNPGRKLVSVGVPLAAAHLLRPSAAAQCYSTPLAHQKSALSRSALSFPALDALFARLAEEAALLSRGVFLFFLFAPLLLTAPVMLLTDSHRDAWMRLMRWTLERAGPAFIKWAQWAATRPDLFAPDVCSTLEALQTDAPSHSFQHTRTTVEAAFNCPLERLFVEFSTDPVASGSIAQVHRAVLSPEGAELARRQPSVLAGLLPLPSRAKREAVCFGEGAAVAVKVRHPGVSEIMERDFALMRRAAAIVGALPGAGGAPQLKESLMQFGAPMREQLDLREEAAHLSRFADNFKWWSGVRFPLPAAPPLVTSDVLVESFEQGKHISEYVRGEAVHNKRLADLGLHCYLKMLLRDNFIHADLHPGNILVSFEDPGAKTGALAALAQRLGKAIGWEANSGLPLPKLVLLDVGMTARLSNEDQRNLVGFFSSLSSMDGGAVADAVLSFSEVGGMTDPLKFRAEMDSAFAALDPEYMRENTPEVVSELMDVIRKHGVHLKGVISTVVFSTLVLEGWSSKLNPDIRILESLKELLPSGRWERLGAAMDNVLESRVLAVA